MQTIPMSKVIRRRKTDEVIIPKFEESKEDVLARIRARRDLKSMSERVAGDSLFFKNYYYPGAREYFSNTQQTLQTVDKYFPYAVGGPLYIDEPMMENEEKDCEQKALVMRKLGLRYLIIKRTMNELDCMEAIA